MKFPKQGVDLRKSMEQFERSLVIQAIRQAKGHVVTAAKLLLVTRQTVYNLLIKHDLKADRDSGLN